MSLKLKHGIRNLQKSELVTFLERLKELPDAVYNIYVFNTKPNRTKSQNKYYWGIIVPSIVQATKGSYTKDEIHEILKFKFNLKRTVINGETVEYPGSTRDMDTKEFTEYIQQVKLWAFEQFEITVSDPRDLTDLEIIELHENY